MYIIYCMTSKVCLTQRRNLINSSRSQIYSARAVGTIPRCKRFKPTVSQRDTNVYLNLKWWWNQIIYHNHAHRIYHGICHLQDKHKKQGFFCWKWFRCLLLSIEKALFTATSGHGLIKPNLHVSTCCCNPVKDSSKPGCSVHCANNAAIREGSCYPQVPAHLVSFSLWIKAFNIKSHLATVWL